MDKGFVAGLIGLATLVVVASIVFQVLTQPNAVPLANTTAKFGGGVVTTLFK